MLFHRLLLAITLIFLNLSFEQNLLNAMDSSLWNLDDSYSSEEDSYIPSDSDDISFEDNSYWSSDYEEELGANTYVPIAKGATVFDGAFNVNEASKSESLVREITGEIKRFEEFLRNEKVQENKTIEEIENLEHKLQEVTKGFKSNCFSSSLKSSLIQRLSQLSSLLEEHKNNYLLSSSDHYLLYDKRVRRIINLIGNIKKITGVSPKRKSKKNMFIDYEHIVRPIEKSYGQFGGGHFPPSQDACSDLAFECFSENASGQQLGYWTCDSKYQNDHEKHYKISTIFSEKDVEKIWDIILLAESKDDEDNANYVYGYFHDDGSCVYFRTIRDESVSHHGCCVIKTAYPIFVQDRFFIVLSKVSLKDNGALYDLQLFFLNPQDLNQTIDQQSFYFRCGGYPLLSDQSDIFDAPIMWSPLDIFMPRSSGSFNCDDACLSKVLTDIQNENYCFRIKDCVTGKIDPEWSLIELKNYGTEQTAIYVRVKRPTEMFSSAYHTDLAKQAVIEIFLPVYLVLKKYSKERYEFSMKDFIRIFDTQIHKLIGHYKRCFTTSIKYLEMDTANSK